MGITYIEENKSAVKKVEKGKLSERIGRKVMDLKHCHCEKWSKPAPAKAGEAISCMPWSPGYRLYFFVYKICFLSLEGEGVRRGLVKCNSRSFLCHSRAGGNPEKEEVRMNITVIAKNVVTKQSLYQMFDLSNPIMLTERKKLR